MATVLLAEEAEAAFAAEGEESAAAKGVDVDGIVKIFGEGLKSALAIYDIIRLFKKAGEEEDERRRNRYSVGLLYNYENRDNLIKKGLIPSYYSKDSITNLLRSNILPFGWSEDTAINQGFENEINAGEIRKRNIIESKIMKDRIVRERDIAKNISTLSLFEKKLKNNKQLEAMKTQIM